MLIDSHCHLGSEEFSQNLDEIMARAAENDVRLMLNAGGRFDMLGKQLDICRQYPQVYTVSGVHPHDARDFSGVKAEDVLKNTVDEKVVAIGECGLDYYYDFSPRDVQIKVFQEMIKAAQESNLPLIVHSREADDDLCSILRENFLKKNFKGVIHCYSSSWKVAETALEIGFYLSASGMITFKNAVSLRESFKKIPFERLLVETDAPYLAPIPFRGQVNEPAHVKETAKCVAAIKGVDFEKISAITTNNFFNLFDKIKGERVSNG